MAVVVDLRALTDHRVLESAAVDEHARADMHIVFDHQAAIVAMSKMVEVFVVGVTEAVGAEGEVESILQQLKQIGAELGAISPSKSVPIDFAEANRTNTLVAGQLYNFNGKIITIKNFDPLTGAPKFTEIEQD
jgi:hypothetical protein